MSTISVLVQSWEAFVKDAYAARLKETESNIQEADHVRAHPEEQVASFLWDKGTRLSDSIVKMLATLESSRYVSHVAHAAHPRLVQEWHTYQWKVRAHPNVFTPYFKSIEGESDPLVPGPYSAASFSNVTLLNLFNNMLWNKTNDEITRPRLLEAVYASMRRRAKRHDDERLQPATRKRKRESDTASELHMSQDQELASAAQRKAKMEATRDAIKASMDKMVRDWTDATQTYALNMDKLAQAKEIIDIQRHHIVPMESLQNKLAVYASVNTNTLDTERKVQVLALSSEIKPYLDKLIKRVKRDGSSRDLIQAFAEEMTHGIKDERRALEAQEATEQGVVFQASVLTERKQDYMSRYRIECRRVLREELNGQQNKALQQKELLIGLHWTSYTEDCVKELDKLADGYKQELDSAIDPEVGPGPIPLTTLCKQRLSFLRAKDLTAFKQAAMAAVWGILKKPDTPERDLNEQVTAKLHEWIEDQGIHDKFAVHVKDYVAQETAIMEGLELRKEPISVDPVETCDNVVGEFLKRLRTKSQPIERAIESRMHKPAQPDLPPKDADKEKDLFMDWYVEPACWYAYKARIAHAKLPDPPAVFKNNAPPKFGQIVRGMYEWMQHVLSRG